MSFKKYPHKIILASSSQKRQELLETLGFKLIVTSPNINETRKFNESSKELVVRLSVEKTLVVQTETELPIVAADTIVCIENKIFGKPKNALDARKMLSKLSGNTHKVFTGYSIRYKNKIISDICETKVVFRKIFVHEIESYIRTNEWKNKSGACSMQGLSCQFVASIYGSYTNILGLPLEEFLSSFRKILF